MNFLKHFTNCLTNILYIKLIFIYISDPLLDPKSQLTFICHVYIDVFNLEEFDKSFMILSCLMSSGQFVYRTSLNCVCVEISLRKDSESAL